MIDFHSHFLPSVDDGARDIDMSLEMLRLSRAGGVSRLVSTSHCYAYSSEDIEDFLKRRNEAYAALKAGAAQKGTELPEIRLGSEVHLTCDISEMRSVRKLCIEGTDYILLEMPAAQWSDGIIDCVYKLSLKGITPIIAHMERNLSQMPELLNQLYSLDILIQINAESFAIGALRKYIDSLMKNSLIHIVGTDMHNISRRGPNMDIAKKHIAKRYGSECWEYLQDNARRVLDENALSYRDMRSFKKKSLF